jgi:hypothetical protein
MEEARFSGFLAALKPNPLWTLGSFFFSIAELLFISITCGTFNLDLCLIGLGVDGA